MQQLSGLIDLIYEINERNGFHDRFNAIKDEEALREHLISHVMLVVGELSEAVEELRNGRGINEHYYSKGGKPEGFEVELVDAAIRIFNILRMVQSTRGIVDVFLEKLEYNKGRGHMHGGKTI